MISITFSQTREDGIKTFTVVDQTKFYVELINPEKAEFFSRTLYADQRVIEITLPAKEVTISLDPHNNCRVNATGEDITVLLRRLENNMVISPEEYRELISEIIPPDSKQANSRSSAESKQDNGNFFGSLVSYVANQLFISGRRNGGSRTPETTALLSNTAEAKAK